MRHARPDAASRRVSPIMTFRRRRPLTEEERAHWRAVTEKTKPLATARETLAPMSRPIRPPLTPAVEDPAPAPSPPTARRTVKPTGPAMPTTTTPAPSGLDRATETQLRKGRRAPDAKLDLHGMTAARAHHALNAFIRSASAAGHRCVLVVTGKGGAAMSREFGDPAPGVLRREAPVWLATEPLRALVVNVSQAHPRHGGGGALYVYLKKRR